MISIIDTLKAMGDFPVAKAEDIEINANTRLDDAMRNKVDKVGGKGLSTNDYTTDDKNKLSDISNIFTKIEE